MGVFRLFRKVDDYREPPGLERVVLSKLPLFWAGGTAVPLLVILLGRLIPAAGPALEMAKQQRILDFIMFGALLTVWTAALTVAIGCLVVIVMKGPHYAADSYYLDGSHQQTEKAAQKTDHAK